MSTTIHGRKTDSQPNRRAFVTAITGGMALASVALAQKVDPVPAPRDWSNNVPVKYPDPDVVALDPRFSKYIIGNTPMQRLFTGTFWAEGPAWNGVGRYLVY